MIDLELLQGLAVALGIGLLIGLERGWVYREEAEGERALGLRTLGLSGLLGGAAGAVAASAPAAGGPFLAGVFVIYAALIGIFRYREMVADRTYGATTVMAALLVFVLGVLAVMVDKLLAAAAGVAAAGLLALKPALHAWLRKLTWPELRAALVLLAMSVILLPLLPDRGFGPFEALNPYELWLMVVLIAAVSSIGYVAIRIAGERWGILLSAVAGGLVSSTAVTLSLARLAKDNQRQSPLLAAGILVANTTMLGRVLVLVGVFNAGLLAMLGPPMAAAALVLAGWSWWLQRGHEPEEGGGAGLTLGSPFELATVLKFGVLLAVVMLASKALTAWLGAAGAFAVAAASGLADVDAVTLSMARLSGVALSPVAAAGAILIAVAVNTLAKATLASTAAGGDFGRRLLLPLAAAVATGLAGLLVAFLLAA